ncbi:caspase, EACC1-associated type [Streptomyces populi]
MPVPDRAASRAVLIGVGDYTHSTLPSLPTAEEGARVLADLLRNPLIWGLPPQHVTLLGSTATKEEILTAVRDAARQATDTVLVYFAGHGLRNRLRDQLYLALATTDQNHPQIGTLPYLELREVLRQAGYRARFRITIFDCCYSGLAGTMSPATPSSRSELAHMLHEPAEPATESPDGHGDCVLTSAPSTHASFAPAAARFPEFTGELIDILDHGITGAGQTLTLEEIWRAVHQRLLARGSPEPQQFAQNNAARRAQFLNRAAPGLPPATAVRPRTWQVFFELPMVMTEQAGVLYACNNALCVALDALSGDVRWVYRSGLALGAAHLAVDAGVVCVSLTDGTIRALDAASGGERWRFDRTGFWPTTWPLAAGQDLLFCSVAIGPAMGAMRALDLVTGTERWSKPLVNPPSQVAASAGLVYFGTFQGSVRAIEASTGRRKWSRHFAAGSIPALLLSGSVVYATGSSYVGALDAATGTTLWRKRIGGLAAPPPAWGDGLLYATNTKQVDVLDAASGASRRTYKIRSHAAPTVSDGRVYIRSGGITAFDAATGAGIWHQPLGRYSDQAPVVAHGLVYTSANDQFIWALDAATGQRPEPT